MSGIRKIKAIPVTLHPNDPSVSHYNEGKGIIVGYLPKGSFYSTDILEYLGLDGHVPCQSEFDVFIVKRTDVDSSVIVPKEFLSKLMVLDDVEDYNEIQKMFEEGTFFIPELAEKKHRPEKKKCTVTKRKRKAAKTANT